MSTCLVCSSAPSLHETDGQSRLWPYRKPFFRISQARWRYFRRRSLFCSQSCRPRLLQNLAREISPYGVTVNSVTPGLINTEIWKSLPKDEAQKVIDNIPMGRPGEPQEVADTVVFLASKEASYITGEEIDINGGQHMD